VDPATVPPERVLAYAGLLADRCQRACAGQLRAAYLHGSAALGGWVPDRSDVDVLLVTEDDIEDQRLAAVASELLAAADKCPGRELECSVVAVAQAVEPRPPWPFLLHVAAGPAAASRKVVLGDQLPGDSDLLMHYAVCRSAGWPVLGRPPRELIGEIPQGIILGYLAGELGWGLDNAPEAYCVLNACRALIFLADRTIVSKIAGGQTALARGLGPPAVIRRALDQQQGKAPDQPPGSDAAEYVRATAARLRSAASQAKNTGT